MAKRVLGLVLIALFVLAGSVLPAAANDFAAKATNTGINLVVGWVDCPKAWVNEASQGNVPRRVVGAVVTGPAMCGVNTAVRYIGVGVDILTLPFGGNLLKPSHVLQNMETPAGPLK